MKHKTAWITALIAIPLVAAASVLHAQTKDEEKEALWASFINEIQNQIDASEFDLQFTITDTDGKLLDGVKVEMRLERPDVKLLLSGGSESKKPEEKTVDSKFSIHEKGWTRLELMFKKSGYYLEDRYYYINFMPNNPDELGPDGKPKLVMKEDIQIVMYKGVPAADLTGTSGYLIYDLEKSTKTVCDLSAFDKKQERPKKRTVSEKDEEDEEYDDEDEEDEEEYVEEIRIGMKKVDLKAKPELTKYIEVDFRRDENGEVLFDGMLRDTPCPAAFIIRLHSDDPEDGFIVVDKFGPGYVRPEEYEKNCPTAPETGYQKELVFDFGKKSADGKYTYEDIHTFAFVKCGQHYGKVFFNPIYVDIGRNRPLRLFRRKIELMINRTEGDRNVSDGVFYIERKEPDQNRIVPDKVEAKNEAENAPEDKAELAKEQILLIHDALEQYKLDVGTYPSSLQGLEKNVDKSERWDGPYIVPKVPRVDLWGNKYQYRFDAKKGTYRLYLISFDLSETRIGDPPEPAQEQQAEPDDPKQPDIFAGLPLWNLERDGKPEVMLPRLVTEAAKRAEADLRPLGDVQFTPIDAGHSFADLDLAIVDEYAKIVRFIREIEKIMPHLSWDRLEIRVKSARERIASEQQDGASAAASGKVFRLTGRIRAITDTPAAASSASANGKRMDDEPPAVGYTDFLSLLYDLSVSLPDDALVTEFRLINGVCNFTFQTQVRYAADLPRRLRFPTWQIARLQHRGSSDEVLSLVATIAKKDNPEPRKETVSPENKIKTIVARNFFDPDRTPKKEADGGADTKTGDKPAAAENAGGVNKTGGRSAAQDEYPGSRLVNGILYSEDGSTLLSCVSAPNGPCIVPPGVKTIADRAFSGCAGLTEIRLPEGVTKIGRSAFWKCTGLKRINLPDSLEEIGTNAFEECTGLTEIAIPPGIRVIKSSTFIVCTGLKRVDLPDSLTEIEFAAFTACTGLTELTIPPNVTSIGESAFAGCTGLTELTIPPSVTKVAGSVFSKCTGLKHVTLSGELKVISSSMFEACSGLEEIVIPEGITEIKAHAFARCTALKRVTFPDSLEGMAWGVFLKCDSLDPEKLVLPPKLKNRPVSDLFQ